MGYYTRTAVILLLLLLSFTSFAAEPVYLSGLLIQPSPTASRFIFILSQKTYGRVKYIPVPGRVIVEFANTYKHFAMQQTKLDHANVQLINTEETNNGRLRFIFSVKDKIEWDIHFIPSSEDEGTRLQLDIKTVKKIAMPKTTALTSLKQLQKGFQAEVQKAVIAGPDKARIITVAIDPGHGGKDSGAIGIGGIQEKNVVLSIAKKLAQEINQQKNMRAVLTRNGDYFIPLRERIKFARKDKADMFIAIHADAYFNNTASGVSVYALSQRGATSEAARWLAHRDNYSELGGMELNSLSDNDPILRSVLVDLAQTATIQDSIRLGSKVLDALDTISSLHYKHVERAPFVVLKSPDIPSILVETGYISNPLEEQRLNDPEYQKKIAHNLWLGINMYVQQYAEKLG